ncbi:MAG: NDP-sugar synthase [Proteobacteria bacterium]|nr:NDP-sugar synthase [Pseudomonadota bacterium]
MILAAGLGTRMAPLSALRPKPALPVRGLPVIAYLMHLLRHHGVSEVLVNLHHHADLMREVTRRFTPEGVAVTFSPEPRPLGTGGGIRRAVDFLRQSDPCLVLAGDMLLDVDLTGLVSRHTQAEARATLLLRQDARAQSFGTIGVDAAGAVRRIASRFDLGREAAAGVFVGVRVLASRVFDSLPEREEFEDLSDWLAPLLSAGARDIRGEIATPEACTWEPVGTPLEYLQANLAPPPLSFMDSDPLAEKYGVRFETGLVVGAGATLAEGVQLERCVVWDGERVPAGVKAADGVFAGGRFHSCLPRRGERE